MKCPTCRSEVPTGAGACPKCGIDPNAARHERKRKGRRTAVAVVVIIVLAILSYQMAVPLIKELTKTESQRMIVVAKDIGREWSSTEPAVSEDVYNSTEGCDAAQVQLHHFNSTSNMYIDCILMIYGDNETANLSYEAVCANLTSPNMTVDPAGLGDRSAIFTSVQEGAEGWLRYLLVVQGTYVVFIEAREYGPVVAVDLPLLLDMGVAQLEKLS